jgi:hypothetical protein
MRKLIASGLAALTFAGAVAAGGSAAAEPYRHHHHHDNSGAAVAAGIAGLAIGAALASGDHYYTDDYGYRRLRPGYYDGYWYGPPAGAYGYYYRRDYDGPRRCRTTRIWDPYLRGYVERTRCW